MSLIGTSDLLGVKMETVTPADLGQKIRVVQYFLGELHDLPPWFEDPGYVHHLMTSLNKAGVFAGGESFRWHAVEMGRYLHITRPGNEAELPSGFSASEFVRLLTSALQLLEAERDGVPAPELAPE
jgi:hypothetical protein